MGRFLHRFDAHFRAAKEKIPVTPSPGTWQKIHAKLDHDAHQRGLGRLNLQRYAAISMLTVLLVCFYVGGKKKVGELYPYYATEDNNQDNLQSWKLPFDRDTQLIGTRELYEKE
jgi:hypothetical protein